MPARPVELQEKQMAVIEIKVPDIGDYSDVPVIEVLVAVGDSVAKDQGLVTLESDKATLEVPSSAAGVVKELKVKVGDPLSEGALVLLLETEGEAAAPAKAETKAAPAAAAPTAAPGSKPPVTPSHRAPAEPAPSKPALASGKPADIECKMVVLGAGPGGYTAAFRAADLGLDTVLIERYASLGGVCLNVGCIPSKALLHAAAVIDEVAHAGDFGVDFGQPRITLDKLREYKEKVVGKLTGGLASMAKQRKVRTVTGVASFVSPNELEIVGDDGKPQLLRFEHCIIAAGSQAVKLPNFPWDDKRVMDSTDALELHDIPKTLLVVGGGIIGLEMATVYSALGSKVTVVEFMDQLMPGADKDLVKPLADRLKKQGVEVHLKTKATDVKADKSGITVSFEAAVEGEKPGLQATAYDRVLVAVGRSPNGKKIGADKAGVTITERGFIPVDRQMRTNVPHIFAIGDIVGNPMLAHKATHEGKLAAEVAAGEKKEWVARVIPSVAYTNPEIAWVGVTETEAKAKGLKVGVAKFPWAASGRAIGIGRTEGFTKLIFDEETHRVIGGAIVGVHAGDLLAEIGLAIEMGAEAEDIGHTIHAHPTLSESVGMAAEVYDGTITDLYIPKKK
ncbi:Dihydrolipoyl dehydrogenase (E3 component of pyruvate and 2-oxoglutarate dehydrogenases complexes) (Dihydrolipoamide dehydrogenase) (Glycine cleavage system L protein) [Xanthomonas phaseoli pv. phaseoli]|uniref:Dihydrolipoyl dehydrogenase n=4 Tax=Xanthomonas TaxID=338 RepID=A0AB38E525_XANCH|nr:Dihydrolipoyl dehydrogenase (E3 component of pyruvate and 2-oxoglutarate dehydrogenases complexes) (Dihydrolipoamide dehydrogenase) (Glycine cleavage system L protein) [Xanthomonas phaseoli pv. phaseoli]SON90594.1 Dihydrolipoyl dehydrogenase (E3 component of pyruvate and 2-oxoglutarate dehydrogenases complexes) (Dihydrolipoamide dehydrogenase) (Glycine cleavage system L protein) [Xanthomonas phaseoli pv. phaseoli]SON92541.1 Dihydrolipoyl dehydrogenase (E3 component of pyruvate and 2-oxoglutara